MLAGFLPLNWLLFGILDLCVKGEPRFVAPVMTKGAAPIGSQAWTDKSPDTGKRLYRPRSTELRPWKGLVS